MSHNCSFNVFVSGCAVLDLFEWDGEVVGSLSNVELNSTPTVCSEGFLTRMAKDYLASVDFIARITPEVCFGISHTPSDSALTSSVQECVQKAGLASTRLACKQRSMSEPDIEAN